MKKGPRKWYFFSYGKGQYQQSNPMHVLKHGILHNNSEHLVEEIY